MSEVTSKPVTLHLWRFEAVRDGRSLTKLLSHHIRISDDGQPEEIEKKYDDVKFVSSTSRVIGRKPHRIIVAKTRAVVGPDFKYRMLLQMSGLASWSNLTQQTDVATLHSADDRTLLAIHVVPELILRVAGTQREHFVITKERDGVTFSVQSLGIILPPKAQIVLKKVPDEGNPFGC